MLYRRLTPEDFLVLGREYYKDYVFSDVGLLIIYSYLRKHAMDDLTPKVIKFEEFVNDFTEYSSILTVIDDFSVNEQDVEDNWESYENHKVIYNFFELDECGDPIEYTVLEPKSSFSDVVVVI